MKGFIVGYLQDWADSLNPIIIGYYTSWTQALQVAAQLEQENIKRHRGLHQVYVTEVLVNKTYSVRPTTINWFDNYTYYTVQTRHGKTMLRSARNKAFSMDLSNPPTPEPTPSPEPVQQEWVAVARKRSTPRGPQQQQRSQQQRRRKRLSRPVTT